MNSTEQSLLQAAIEIQQFFKNHHWQFALVGGLTLMRWGATRTTVDVDATLLTMFANEEQYIDTLLAHFQSRIADAKEFALTHRVMLLTASNGVAVDIMFGDFPFEQQMIERSSLFTFEKDVVLRTCSAEDLIVLKAFAARDKDWADVHSILQRQKGNLDMDYIREYLSPLCELKGAPEIMVKFERLLES
jgi:predicted nucleotidyltransferase